MPPEPNTLYTSRYEPQQGPDSKKHIGIEDHFLMSTSEVHDRMNMRHAYVDDIGCQSKILQLATEFGIQTAVMDWVDDSIVRPTAFAGIPNPEEYFDNDYRKIAMDWVNMPLDQKLILLSKHFIREEDYTTASLLAKL